DDNYAKFDELLRAAGVRDNTIVVFLTDNGSTGGVKVFNAGLRGAKASLYDGGHRAIGLLRWPAGGLRPQSDIDLFVLVSQPLDELMRQTLVNELLKISGRRADVGPSRPLEVTVVVKNEVVPWRCPPRVDLVYGEWLRDEFTAGKIAPAAPSADLAILLSTLLQNHHTLLGLPASEVLHPVPFEDLRQAIGD
ncbi:MAG: sulfatase-like hydrolase/transferase, partial [Blastochloris sp.]|nr:sulfatase-like hydrolase/transferase [Blastochloris sp.]